MTCDGLKEKEAWLEVGSALFQKKEKIDFDTARIKRKKEDFGFFSSGVKLSSFGFFYQFHGFFHA
jgi:hypothetical protein